MNRKKNIYIYPHPLKFIYLPFYPFYPFYLLSQFSSGTIATRQLAKKPTFATANVRYMSEKKDEEKKDLTERKIEPHGGIPSIYEQAFGRQEAELLIEDYGGVLDEESIVPGDDAGTKEFPILVSEVLRVIRVRSVTSYKS